MGTGIDKTMAIMRRLKRAGGGPTAPFGIGRKHSAIHTGPIISPVGGRTDHHPMDVAAGSYVLPADHVSALGQGNTQNGMAVLSGMFKGGPYGTSIPQIGKGKMGTGRKMRADGGANHGTEPVPILAAGGEYVIPPEVVAEIGGGDMDRGHKILDKWVVATRKDHVKTLKKLPGPAR